MRQKTVIRKHTPKRGPEADKSGIFGLDPNPGKEVWALEVEGRPDLTKLKKHLLKRAGKKFQRNDFLTIELTPDRIKKLAAEGRFLPGDGALFIALPSSNCHQNSMVIAADKRAELWTGMALSEDDCWRFHSWVVRTRDRQIVETTEARTLYFGTQYPVSKWASKLHNALGVANWAVVQELFD